MTRWLVLVSIVLLVAVGGVAVAITHESSSSVETPDALALTSSARHQYADLAGLVGASDLVVVGRVIADEDGRVFGAPGARGSERSTSAIRSHVLTLEVEQVLVGADRPTRADSVVLVEEEYALADGTPVRVDGMRRGRVDDRGVWFLTASGDTEFPAYAVVNAQGRYLFEDRTVRGGDRSDTFVRGIERLDPTQLRDEIVAAATSISR